MKKVIFKRSPSTTAVLKDIPLNEPMYAINNNNHVYGMVIETDKGWALFIASNLINSGYHKSRTALIIHTIKAHKDITFYIHVQAKG